MSHDSLNINDKLILKQKTKEVSAIVNSILSKYNYDDFSNISKPEKLELNEIGIIEITTSEPIICDEMAQDSTKNMILINPKNNETVGACVLK